ncbi:hypothetical protein DESPIG_02174 [Desulfovibrio piger ATCC 29098]|uniref:Uncharacterized protein n=1 Tax=Desulfovibrio piger ATCC 29098 TaxID=411464 RepID=B6WVQ6_9BACT|nr:hypothetical protein DESPIG_02174 [Desulfovibrio piger ATCC 29098]
MLSFAFTDSLPFPAAGVRPPPACTTFPRRPTDSPFSPVQPKRHLRMSPAPCHRAYRTAAAIRRRSPRSANDNAPSP